MKLLSAENVYKTFGIKDAAVQALQGVSLEVEEGEMVAIMGKSGSGKSTLLNVLGGLMKMDSGSLRFRGELLDFSNRKVLTHYRRNCVGFVVQYFALISDLNVYDNVMLPLRYQGIPGKQAGKMAEAALEMLGILEKRKAYPDELSGGQQQRAAIARAIVKNPDLILADEPTGALDEATGDEVMRIFRSLQESGKTILIVTHDDKVAECCDRIVYLKDGAVAQNYFGAF